MYRFAVFILIGLIPNISSAQEKAEIRGYVHTESGQALAGVNVFLKNTVLGSATDQTGFFSIKNIPAGQYQLQVEMIGYERPLARTIKIKAGEIQNLNYTLKVQAISFDECVTVTATRGHSLVTEVPASVNVIRMEDLEARNPQNLAEALQNVQGVYFKDYGGPGNTKTISIRGSSSEQVLVMLDGQRLNNPQTGQVDFATLSVEGVDRIEVVRGGNSALYGADAVGGVINIITRGDHTTSGLDGSLRFAYGSFHTNAIENSLNFRKPSLQCALSYKFLQSEGDFDYRQYGRTVTHENAGINSQDVYLRLARPFGDPLYNRSLELSLNHYSAERGAPGTIENLYRFAKMWDRSNQYNLIYSGKVLNLLNDLRIQTYHHNSSNYYKNVESLVKVNSRFKVQSDGSELQLRLFLIPKNIFTYGLGLRIDQVRDLQIDTSNQRTSNYVYLINELKLDISDGLFNSFTVVPSLRYENSSDYGAHTSPKIGFVINLGQQWQTTFKFNAGASYRAPTFNDLYWPADPWTVGNLALQPESGFDFDGGIRLQYPILQGFYFESTFFQNRMDDLIIWQQSNGKWSPENVNKALIRGLENGATVHLFQKQVTLAGNYTYLDARNKTTERTEYNKRLIYRPRHSANLNLTAKLRRVSLHYQFNYTGLRYTKPENTLYLPAYQTSDVTLTVTKLYHDVEYTCSFQVKNLYDASYRIVENMPIPGREFRLSLKIGY